MKYIFILMLISSCMPKNEPGIDLNDWSEATHNTNKIPRDTYTVVIQYAGNRINDTLETMYSHYPTEKDIYPEYLSNLPTFKAPDNERAKLYVNVKKISVIKASVSANNIEYIKSMLRRQDSILRAKK